MGRFYFPQEGSDFSSVNRLFTSNLLSRVVELHHHLLLKYGGRLAFVFLNFAEDRRNSYHFFLAV